MREYEKTNSNQAVTKTQTISETLTINCHGKYQILQGINGRLEVSADQTG